MSEIKEKPSIAEIRSKLIEKLRPSGWAGFLKAHLQSSDFESLISFLVDEHMEGRGFTPAFKQLFRAFELCPVDQVKVVLMGQDPYPQPKVADGVAFSCSNTGKPEVSLRYILGAIEDTVPFEDRAPIADEVHRFNLDRWSSQGVLVLNTALTTEIGKAGKHVQKWEPFMQYLVDMLNFQQSGLVWMLMGKQAQGYESLIGEHHAIVTSTHPAYAAYQKTAKWNCNDIFNKANTELLKYKKEKIMW